MYIFTKRLYISYHFFNQFFLMIPISSLHNLLSGLKPFLELLLRNKSADNSPFLGQLFPVEIKVNMGATELRAESTNCPKFLYVLAKGLFSYPSFLSCFCTCSILNLLGFVFQKEARLHNKYFVETTTLIALSCNFFEFRKKKENNCKFRCVATPQRRCEHSPFPLF